MIKAVSGLVSLQDQSLDLFFYRRDLFMLKNIDQAVRDSKNNKS